MAAALGLAYAMEGRIATGLALAEQVAEQTAARGTAWSLVRVVTSLSETYLLADRLEEARQRAEQAYDLARQYQQRGYQARPVAPGREHGAAGVPRRRAGRQPLPSGLALAEASMRPLQAHCHQGLGMLYARQGQQEQACAARPLPSSCTVLWQ